MRHFGEIYNSKHAALFFSYTFRHTAAIDFVPVLQAISPTEIKKGMKVYNYDARRVFSLTLDECIVLLDLLNNLPKHSTSIGNITVSISNDGATLVTVTHFPGTKEEKSQGANTTYSKFIIYIKHPHVQFAYQYTSPTEKVDIRCPCSVSDLEKFKMFIRNLPTFIATLNAMFVYDSYTKRTMAESITKSRDDSLPVFFADDEKTFEEKTFEKDFADENVSITL